MKNGETFVIVHPQNQARLCNDGKWRNKAFFGTFDVCVKTFKSRFHANKKASEKQFRGSTKIVSISKNDRMDEKGKIVRGTIQRDSYSY